MARTPHVTLNKELYAQLCKQLEVNEPSIEFFSDPRTDKDGTVLRGVKGDYSYFSIRVFLHRYNIGRIIPENKRKKITLDIVETILHEMRHHYQARHRTMPHRNPDEDYWTHPTECDARMFARNNKMKYRKLVTIS